jgi:AcrR family transcriptional regulator
MSPEEEKQRSGLTRELLVAAALELIGSEGLDGLSMRGLADQLQVKAASLYWHVRDRRELVEMLADSILETVRLPRGSGDWRSSVVAIAAAVGKRVAAQKDADRVLLAVPESLERSQAFDALSRELEKAGVQAGEARELARMVMVHVITTHPPTERPLVKTGGQALIAIDSGSRGVLLRAGSSGMQGLVAAAHAGGGAAPAIVRGETVVVRRLRGVGLGEIELNPHHPWSFKIQGPTWNTTLDVGGLDVRAIKLDSGAAKVECFLPAPRGVVPIEVSGGVVGVTMHRPKGTVVAVDISGGAVRVKLDGYSLKAAVLDSQWESDAGGTVAPDRYQLRISGGAVQVNLDAEAKVSRAPEAAAPAEVSGESASALDILLDGVETRVRTR